MRNMTNVASCRNLPKWVPVAARHYLAHTEEGQSIRALARETDCHPSTILRQVRRFEGRRDDPLVDAALRSLAEQTEDNNEAQETKHMKMSGGFDQTLTQERIDSEAKRILRRMCEPRAVLAVAREMETAVVVRENDAGESLRTAIVDREIAQAMALKEWISSPEDGNRIRRYFVTNSGRAALRRLTAADENKAHGFAEQRGTFDPDLGGWSFPKETDGMRSRSRYYATESPLLGLARRKDRDGSPFLCNDLVKAGERLREDFELSQIGGPGVRTFEAFLETVELSADSMVPEGALKARVRVQAAMQDLGLGLGDVVLRCCCLLEGLEVTERNLGWSARSGKIVLRIALQRLKVHYETTQGKFAPMIG
jgi:DNA-binding MarR family transcriptional regulator